MPAEKNNKSETFGQRLARLRKEKGFTQLELAKIIEISQSALTDYERGRLRLHDKLIVKIAKALNITTDELLGVKYSSSDESKVSLRFIKRLKEIEKLPEVRKKAILRTLDDLIFASEKNK